MTESGIRSRDNNRNSTRYRRHPNPPPPNEKLYHGKHIKSIRDSLAIRKFYRSKIVPRRPTKLISREMEKQRIASNIEIRVYYPTYENTYLSLIISKVVEGEADV